MKRFLIFVMVVGLFVLALFRWNEKHSFTRRSEKFTPATADKIDLNDVKVLAAMDEEYTKLVDAVVPSVVSITASKRVTSGYVIDPFDMFFNRRLRGIPQEREQRSLGSGVIVSKEGHILTNHHVVADVDAVTVQFSDGKELPAQIIGSDADSDIAVLKVEGSGFVPLPIGDSDKVRVGSHVIAVGNPFGLEETVTQGIISAKGRRATQDSANEFFQTDAAINPGNSGGPLVNLRGEIIGINSSIYSGSGGWQGVGFAIPSNAAKRTLDSILKNGRVIHGYLGVLIQPLTPDLAQQLGLPSENGALVAEVTADSPAEKAGITRGDVITKINGHPVDGIQELRARVATVPIGDKAEVTFLRGGQEKTVSATIAEQPENPQVRPPAAPVAPPPSTLPAPPPPSPSGSTAQNVFAGLHVGEIPPDHQDDLPPNAHGVMVMEIDPDSPAAESLQQGDVIEEIARQPVTSVADYNRIVASLDPGAKQVLFICRGKTRSFVVLQPR